MNPSRADRLLLASAAATLGSAAIFGPGALSIGVPLGVSALLLTDGIFRADSSVLYPTLVRGRTDRPAVALTFDDGPDPEVTPHVLDTLAEHQARGTFFIIGRHLERHTAVAERLLKEGHELGNHSWQHSYFQNFYPVGKYGADVDRCSQLIRSLTGSPREPLFRPPVGLKSPAVSRVAHQRNLTLVAWSIHSRDTMAKDARAVATGVLNRIRPGDIVLLHDGHDRDRQHRPLIRQVLPLLLTGLRERGLTPVPVSELLTDTQLATRAPSAATLTAGDGRN